MRQQIAVAAHSLALTVARACAPAGSGMCRSRDRQPGNASIERWKFIRGQRAMRQREGRGRGEGKWMIMLSLFPCCPFQLPGWHGSTVCCLMLAVKQQDCCFRVKLWVQTLGRRVGKGIGKKGIAQQERLLLSISSHLLPSPSHLPFVTTSIPVTKTRSRFPNDADKIQADYKPPSW